jgi:hypothetical protein
VPARHWQDALFRTACRVTGSLILRPPLQPSLERRHKSKNLSIFDMVKSRSNSCHSFMERGFFTVHWSMAPRAILLGHYNVVIIVLT